MTTISQHHIFSQEIWTFYKILHSLPFFCPWLLVRTTHLKEEWLAVTTRQYPASNGLAVPCPGSEAPWPCSSKRDALDLVTRWLRGLPTLQLLPATPEPVSWGQHLLLTQAAKPAPESIATSILFFEALQGWVTAWALNLWAQYLDPFVAKRSWHLRVLASIFHFLLCSGLLTYLYILLQQLLIQNFGLKLHLFYFLGSFARCGGMGGCLPNGCWGERQYRGWCEDGFGFGKRMAGGREDR